MNVSLKTFMPAAAAGLLALTSCTSASQRAKVYMKDKPYLEYQELTDTENETLIQSRLDSMAYRDIFNGTKLAKDSASVAEFNKIAAEMRGYQPKETNHWNRRNAVRSTLINQHITTQELDKIESNTSFLDGDLKETNQYQHDADDWAYRKFFTKKGIMTDGLAKKCDEVSKLIRP